MIGNHVRGFVSGCSATAQIAWDTLRREGVARGGCGSARDQVSAGG